MLASYVFESPNARDVALGGGSRHCIRRGGERAHGDGANGYARQSFIHGPRRRLFTHPTAAEGLALLLADMPSHRQIDHHAQGGRT